VADPATLYPIYNNENLLRLGYPATYNRKETRIFSRSVLTPFKGFEGVLEYTLDDITSDTKTFSKNITMIESNQNVNNIVPVPIYANNKGTQNIKNLNAYASYSFDINKVHNIKILQGFSQGQIVNASLNVNRKDLISDQLPSISTGTGEILASDTYSDATTISSFYRVNYNYMEKYLLEANGRYDGSSKFPKLTRFGYFPSFSGGWQVAKENFMSFSKGWLNEFKLRASWGQIGNQNIAPYGYFPEMTVMNPRPTWIVNGAGTLPVSLNIPPLVRTDFTWEVVETTNFGGDLSLFNNRLQASGDVYTRKTIGMLAAGADLPLVLGATAPQQNAADLKVNGWEASLNWRDKIGKVGYRIGVNMFDSQTVITKYGNEANVLKNADGSDAYYVGKKLGEIWGYKNDGFYTIQDFKPTAGGVNGWQNNVWNLNDGVVAIAGVNPRPGDTKYKNLTDDSALTSNRPNQINAGMNTLGDHGDQEVIGNSALRYQYGINGGVTYAGFDFSFMMNGVGKRDVWLDDPLEFPAMNYNSGTTLYSHQVNNYWQPIDPVNGNWEPINPDAKYARIYGQTNSGSGASVNGTNNYKVQDKYLQNGAYLRLQNVSLAYNISHDITKKVGIDGFKVFVSVDNAYTWDHLDKGRDPESLSWGYPYYTTTSFGMNLTF
jgi:TonB-linked SusC/RagA family outer membrane protein